MIKRLEQVAALVVAAGLALVSYWLFFSWAQGGGAQHRRLPPARSMGSSVINAAVADGLAGRQPEDRLKGRREP